MKKRILSVFVIAITAVQFGYSQETKKDSEFGVKWGGYVKADYILDTRRLNDTREGQYLVIPLGEKLDANGDDLNKELGYNQFAIESRLKASFTGPDFLGMKTAGVIEAHFFGNSAKDINSLALRHAYFTLSSDKVEWLFGQYWHPTFVTNVSPGVHAFTAGVPYQPFSRSPQVRFSTKGNVRFTAAIITERDFSTNIGVEDYGGAAVRFAAIPTFHTQLQFGQDDKIVGGFGATLKTVDLNTRLGASALAKNDNKTSLSFIGYAKANLGQGVTWKVYGQYGGNTTEQLMFGGYARKSNGDILDSKVLSAWTEFSGKFNDKLGWGLFGGYTKDGGFGNDYASLVTSSLVENSYRISPRLDYTVGKVRLGTELCYTTAQYANGIAANGDLNTTGVNEVGNFRTALSATYFF